MARRLIVFVALCVNACGGPQTVRMEDGQCTRVSVGDYVVGTAVLHSSAGLPTHTGDYLTRNGCSERIGISTANDIVDAQYDRIVRLRPGENVYDGVERRISVSGRVIPNGANGSPLVNADHVALER